VNLAIGRRYDQRQLDALLVQVVQHHPLAGRVDQGALHSELSPGDLLTFEATIDLPFDADSSNDTSSLTVTVG
jgi:hypothetical protein